MKLTYWIAEHLEDNRCFNIRETTRKAAIARVAAHWEPRVYGPVFKVTVEYTSTFDLIDNCMGEGSGYWECPPLKV